MATTQLMMVQQKRLTGCFGPLHLFPLKDSSSHRFIPTDASSFATFAPPKLGVVTLAAIRYNAWPFQIAQKIEHIPDHTSQDVFFFEKKTKIVSKNIPSTFQ